MASSPHSEWLSATTSSLTSLSSHYLKLLKSGHTQIPADQQSDANAALTQTLIDSQAAEDYALALQNDITAANASASATEIPSSVVAAAELQSLETRVAAENITETATKLLELIWQLRTNVLLAQTVNAEEDAAHDAELQTLASRIKAYS